MSTRWYYGWNVVAVSMLFQAFMFGLTIYMFSFWAEAWMEEFAVDRAFISMGFVGHSLGMAVASPLAGRAMDKLSIRALVIGGMGAFALGFVLIAMATAAWQIIVVYGTFISAGLALAGPLAAQTLAAKWFGVRRGRAIGLVAVGTSIGGMLLPLWATLLLAEIGGRKTHLVLAVVVVLIMPLVWRVIRNTPQDHGIEPEAAAPGEVAGSTLADAPGLDTRTILGRREFWVTIFAFVPAIMAFSTIQVHLRLYTSDLGIDPQRTAFLLSVMAGTMICGKLFFGAMADRLDQRQLYWIAAALLAGSMIMLMDRPGYGRMLGAIALLGFGSGGFLPLLGAIVGSRFGPQDFGRVMGLIYPFLMLNSFGPAIAGWIRDATDSYDTAFMLIVLAMVPAALVMVLMPSQRNARQQTAASLHEV